MTVFLPYPKNCIKGYRKVYSLVWEVINVVTEKAFRRIKVIEFFEKYGLKTAIEAFGVSKSSIYSWRKRLKESGGRFEVLNDKSKAPKNKRKKKREERVVEFIKDIRRKR